jgi:hypothetical protein
VEPLPEGDDKLGDADRHGLTPPFTVNMTPYLYGTFRLEMEERLDLLPVPGPRQTADDGGAAPVIRHRTGVSAPGPSAVGGSLSTCRTTWLPKARG